ncbi:hypothetical protein BGZ61DRAFT_32778 [Ilyonectria robusta]|uniref:uncharacterized protein n=1 Tax=Ilyonectria robusta TaxID=1079257 RepID=UPI001E8D6DAE|nr:uncharacterized protein BGZ61DRAFT_32778 [Ilyonectria robusta]KAH8694578.1 hypothetical protein BGZ61DRAFT_32778 [Ilyonectria robusta]
MGGTGQAREPVKRPTSSSREKTGQSQGVENRPLESPRCCQRWGIPSSRGWFASGDAQVHVAAAYRAERAWFGVYGACLAWHFGIVRSFFFVRLFFRVGLLWHRLGPDGCVWPVGGWVERGIPFPGLGAVVPKSRPHVEALKVSLTDSKPRNPQVKSSIAIAIVKILRSMSIRPLIAASHTPRLISSRPTPRPCPSTPLPFHASTILPSLFHGTTPRAHPKASISHRPPLSTFPLFPLLYPVSCLHAVVSFFSPGTQAIRRSGPSGQAKVAFSETPGGGGSGWKMTFVFLLFPQCAACKGDFCVSLFQGNPEFGVQKTGPDEGFRCDYDDKASMLRNQNPRAGTKVTSRFFAPNWWIDGGGELVFKDLSLIGAVVSSLPSINHGR